MFVNGKTLEARDLLCSFNKRFRSQDEVACFFIRDSIYQRTYVPLPCLHNKYNITTSARTATVGKQTRIIDGWLRSGYFVL